MTAAPIYGECLIGERVDIGGFGKPVQWWRGIKGLEEG